MKSWPAQTSNFNMDLLAMNGALISNCPNQAVESLLQRSALYRRFMAEREQILVHKWIESEKAGRDIGFNAAWVSWVVKHRSRWRSEQRTQF